MRSVQRNITLPPRVQILKARLASRHAFAPRISGEDAVFFDYLPLACAIVEQNNLKILRFNKAAEKLFSVTIDRWLNKPIDRYLAGCDSKKLATAALPDRPSLHYQLRPTTKQGESTFLSAHCSAYTYLNSACYLLVIEDRTAWQKSKMERRKSLRHLELAQSVAQLGSWEFYPSTQRLLLSDNARAIFDIFPTIDAKTNDLDVLIAKMSPPQGQELSQALHDARNGEAFQLMSRVKLLLGLERQVLIRGELITGGMGESIIVGCCIDLTDQIRTQSLVFERDQQYRQLVKLLPDAVLLCDPAGKIIAANPAAANLYHAESSETLVHRSLSELFAPPGQHLVQELTEHFDCDDSAFHTPLIRLQMPDGSQKDAELVAKSIRLESEHTIQILVRDISEQLRIGRELQDTNKRLTQLMGHSLDQIENERKNISEALHDEIGQTLTAINLGVGMLVKQLDGRESQRQAELMRSMSRDAIAKVRDLSLMLRPPQLDELGLTAAIEWLAERMLEPAGVLYVILAGKLAPTSPQTEIIAFRMVQECTSDALLQISVQDDGIGFNLRDQTSHLGLAYMKERAMLAGGSVEVFAEYGHGSRITMNLPKDTPGEATS